MRKVYGALSVLLPVAFSGASGWSDPARADALRKSLQTLRGAADELSEHAGPEAQSFRFLSGSLGRDARRIQLRVERGQTESASYLTRRLTETCIACHTRLPARSGAPFAADLIRSVERQQLSPLALAGLQVATRQFDEALGTYEKAFADPEESIRRLESELPSYLTVALRVRENAARAERGLASVGRRPDVPALLERNLEIWSSAIRDLEPTLHEQPSLARASRILSEGRALSEFPTDGADLAHAILASSMVYRYLDQKQPQGLELAQACYLLGQTEAFTRRSFELSDTEHYLEQAIRLAPHTPLARNAFARLEREILLSYTGSGGEQLPEEIQDLLRELAELSRVDSARNEAAPQ
jgi:hypothetical protein